MWVVVRKLEIGIKDGIFDLIRNLIEFYDLLYGILMLDFIFVFILNMIKFVFVGWCEWFV